MIMTYFPLQQISYRKELSLCRQCLPDPLDKKEKPGYAPFPALLYCFSTIDLLGALYCGHARSGGTVTNSKQYMKDIMNLDSDQIRYLQVIFRHKLVHLALPKGVFYDQVTEKNITWQHNEDPHSRHLEVETPASPMQHVIWGSNSISYDSGFIIGIRRFKDNIKDSVYRKKDGYLERLKVEIDLKNNFKKAINQIHDPTVSN